MRTLLSGAAALSICGSCLAGDFDLARYDSHQGAPAAGIYFQFPLGAPVSGFSNVGFRLSHDEARLFSDFDATSIQTPLQAPLLDAKWFFNGTSMVSLHGMPLMGTNQDGEFQHIFKNDDGTLNIQLVSIAIVGAVSAGIIASCLADNWPCDGDDDGGDGDSMTTVDSDVEENVEGGEGDTFTMTQVPESSSMATSLTEQFFQRYLNPRIPAASVLW